MNKKIAIIGSGLFGLTTYIILKQNNYDCTLFEKKNKILEGASTNNLNRVHFGYHYPRDIETARQSLEGYKTFSKFYKKAIFFKFDNYYFIAKNSKIDFKNYLSFCKKNDLKFKLVNLKNFFLKNTLFEGAIKVQEPIYDWDLIKKEVKKKLARIKYNKIHLNEKVLSVKKIQKNLILESNKGKYKFDYIIDASYEGSNKLNKVGFSNNKYKYQVVSVFEFTSKKINKLGLAVMDGNFFSFLPKGNSNKHIFYHVKHSILREKVGKKFPERWLKFSNLKKKIRKQKKKCLQDFNKYFPNFKIKFSNKFFISSRVLPSISSTDKRVTEVKIIKKRYFKITSAKVDHCVDTAFKVLNLLKTIC